MYNRINGKIVLKGKIKNTSPLLIGSGENEFSDIDVLKDSENKPFIPATSFIGTIRSFIQKHDENLDYLFGKDEQSMIRANNLCITDDSNFSISIRDGIRINNKTGLVEDKSKYDYEIVEPGAYFDLYLEGDIKESNKSDLHKFFTLVNKSLKNQIITFGAKNNSGLGKVEVDKLNLFIYDFSNKKDVFNWFKQNNGTPLAETNDEPIALHDFEIKINLKLKNSIIVKSYPGEPEMPDAVNITSDGKNVLPGTAIKGALRARIERIINTLNPQKTQVIINSLFGFVDTEDKDSRPTKGRILVEEEQLPEFIAELQTRIRIDRFTGGTINSALFDSMPLFDTEIDLDANNVVITVKIRDCKDYEAGLLLLAAKDLWTGDLAIGGDKSIGRGVFDGVSLGVSFKDFNTRISNNINLISSEEKQQMQKYVYALNNEVA